jgi:putative ABC transport system permease protein
MSVEREVRSGSRLARLLDVETRERWFEPAYGDLMQQHLQDRACRRGYRRRAADVAFRLRVLSLVVECVRLRLMAPSGPARSREGMANKVWQDLRYAARGLRKTPGFTVLAALVLALGIGANTALFSVVDSVLLRPLPYADASRLVAVWETDRADGNQAWRVAPANFRDWRDQADVFADSAAFGADVVTLTGHGEAAQLKGSRVTANYFSVLGVRPIAGRTFQPADEAAGAPVVVLGYGAWQSKLGGAPDVVGSGIVLDGERYTVIGVMPPDIYPSWPVNGPRMHFQPEYQDMWRMLPNGLLTQRRSHVLGVVARLKSGATIQQAQQQMDTIGHRLELAYPEDKDAGVLVRPLADEVVGSVRTPLFFLLGAVAAVLMISCANVAGLLLARLTTRQREIAVRFALGASRAALLRQFLVEGALLSVLGAAIGIGIAVEARRLLLQFVPQDLPRLAESGINGRVLGFTLAVSVLAALVFALAPAWSAGRARLSGSLHGTRSTESDRPQRLRNLLVVTQVGLAVMLASAAALLGQSFWRLSQVPTGFRSDHVLVGQLVLPSSTYVSWQQVRGFYEQLLERTRELPGVSSAQIAYDHPLETNWLTGFSVEGQTRDEPPAVQLRIVSPGYFAGMGFQLVEGREFDSPDDASRPGVAVVNASFVRAYLSEGKALDRTILTTAASSNWKGAMPDRFTVVGVVDDARRPGLASTAEPFLYLSSWQFPRAEMKLLVRTTGDPLSEVAPIRGVIASLDRALPLADVTTMDEVVAAEVAQPRLNMLLMSLFGGVALALSMVGVYGLIAFWVTARTREIGLRLALGARPEDVVGLVLARGAWLVLIGASVGSAGALALSRVLKSQVFGISPTDPLTLLGVALAIVGIAIVACLVPARRASRVDPLVALRAE